MLFAFFDAEFWDFVGVACLDEALGLVFEDLGDASFFSCEVSEDSDYGGDFHVLGATVCASEACGAEPKCVAV